MGDIPGDVSGEKAGDGVRSLMVPRTAPYPDLLPKTHTVVDSASPPACSQG